MISFIYRGGNPFLRACVEGVRQAGREVAVHEISSDNPELMEVKEAIGRSVTVITD